MNSEEWQVFGFGAIIGLLILGISILCFTDLAEQNNNIDNVQIQQDNPTLEAIAEMTGKAVALKVETFQKGQMCEIELARYEVYLEWAQQENLRLKYELNK